MNDHELCDICLWLIAAAGITLLIWAGMTPPSACPDCLGEGRCYNRKTGLPEACTCQGENACKSKSM